MATVLRWAVVYWTLTQVIVFCGAVHPIHIQLNLDGKDIIEDIEDYERLPNEKYVILQKIRDLVKMWYNSEDAAKPMYNDDSDRSLVEKAGLIKLYIRGKFQIEEKGGENRYFLWDNKRKGAKELGEFVLRIFKGDPVVIVVFPDDLQTYTGFQFQKEFEEAVQKKNDRITVGRGVINVYLGLGDQNQETQVFTLLEEEIKTQNKMVAMSEKDEKYYSIFAQHHPNAFSFRTVFTAWRTELKPVNIFQVKILEADSVAVKLISACTSDKKGLKVGSHTAQGLADILLKLLRVQDVETHPEQRIRVKLPKTCGTAKEREAFTGHLVDNLENKNLKVYGKEPSVHIHVYSDDDTDDVQYIKKLHKDDIFGKINDEIKTDQDLKSISLLVSSAKELFIHIHCHGVFSGNVGTICGKDSKTLADILSKFVKTLLTDSVPKNGIIKFHVCEAGSENGKKYVNKFLTNLDKLVQTYHINIQESLAYMYKTSQIKEHPQVTVPCAAWYGSETWPNVHEKQVFGRFTVRTIKTYKSFSVLPLTEYSLSCNV